MLRADSRLGRLVTALAGLPPHVPTAPHARFGSRLMTALAGRPLSARSDRVPHTAARRAPHNNGTSGRPRPGKARWLPGLGAAGVVMVTSMAVLAAQGVLPAPWQHVTPQRPHSPQPEEWRLIRNGRLADQGQADVVMFSPADGRTLVTVSGHGVEEWHLTDPEHPERVRAPFPESLDGVTAASITPDGGTLVTAGPSGLRGQSLDTGRLRWRVAGLGDDVKAMLALNRSVKLLVSENGSTLVRDVRLTDGKPTFGGPSRAGAARSAQFTPDGRTLAVADTEGRAHLWDLSDPRHPRGKGQPFKIPGGGATALAFSPDGRLLAAVGDDRTVRLWDVTDAWKPRYLGTPLSDSGERVITLAFSSDTRLLATVGVDGMASLWWRRELPYDSRG